MAYLRSAADVDRLDAETSTDEQRTFLDDTDFGASAVVSVSFRFPTTDTEARVLGALSRAENLDVRVWIEHRGMVNGEDYDLFLVRVSPGNDLPDDVTVVLENDPYADGEPSVFGTADGN